MTKRRQIYDVGGPPYFDRSLFKVNADGIDLDILIEDLKELGSFQVIRCTRVAFYSFQSQSTLTGDEYLSDEFEYIVEEDAADFHAGRSYGMAESLFRDAKRYSFNLNDIGRIIVICQRIEVTKQTSANFPPARRRGGG
jgi:hypothetical protein